MIVAEAKPIDEILTMIRDFRNVLLVGCRGCVTVCLAGGEKEVGILASALRMAVKAKGKAIETAEITLERQCDKEYVEEIASRAAGCEALISMACGAGVQFLAERYADKPVLPALNTRFIGIAKEQGIWLERCGACGNCLLDKTAGVCPIARCAKSLLNGPCGGSSRGHCEISPDQDCAWQLIHDRLKALGRLDELEDILPLKDWSTSRDGGPRKTVREDLKP
jgi:ferredoxin